MSIHGDLISQVLHIRHHITGHQEPVRGTAFFFYRNYQRYIVTALHVVPDIYANPIIEVFLDNKWNSLRVNVIRLGRGAIDIAVLELPKPPRSNANSMVKSDIQYGDHIHFLGFPYGLSGGTVGATVFPIPFVKTGIISGVIKESGVTRLFFDGYNNPGFSGGPLAYMTPSGLAVAGVVTSAFMAGTENTGIGVALSINHAIDLIDQSAAAIRPGRHS